MNSMEKLKATVFGPTPSLPAPRLMLCGALLSQPAEAEEGRNKDTKGHQYREHEAAVVRGIGVWCAWA